ncbi:hypothetical protein MUK42_04643 [Musa troglodytarum]|uniref:Uncharacterized protein n=1 Tax=Musa troglodytarum TaxID=320322 RepID=A0A9E7GAQ8_9LILI|nr:hypothetical protein MUK42_04643 [Musa troglodytarum]
MRRGIGEELRWARTCGSTPGCAATDGIGRVALVVARWKMDEGRVSTRKKEENNIKRLPMGCSRNAPSQWIISPAGSKDQKHGRRWHLNQEDECIINDCPKLQFNCYGCHRQRVGDNIVTSSTGARSKSDSLWRMQQQQQQKLGTSLDDMGPKIWHGDFEPVFDGFFDLRHT